MRTKFQSTLPQGERQFEESFNEWFNDFNPRSRKGSDSGLSVADAIALISIHAPARGATDLDASGDNANAISIHAPARGATC